MKALVRAEEEKILQKLKEQRMQLTQSFWLRCEQKKVVTPHSVAYYTTRPQKSRDNMAILNNEKKSTKQSRYNLSPHFFIFIYFYFTIR